MDNLLIWNVKGLNGPNKQTDVKLLCNRQEVGLIGLSETKIKASKIERIVKKYVQWLEAAY